MRITGLNKTFDVDVNLVGSKSESNRVLMIGYYGGFMPRVKNISESDDTQLLRKLLEKICVKTDENPSLILDCANAGTVLRFLATALSFRPGSWILTGSDRMMQRPVGDLVNALRKIGADIEYMGQEGFPPLKINGKTPVETLPETSVSVDISRSSQFASSILLALPIFKTDFHPALRLDGDMSSVPYIDMTIDVMQKFGIDVHRDGREIFIKPSDYRDIEYTIESDWTCASYWYEIVAFSENGRARLRNLRLDSKQGDAVVAKWFEDFGVTTVQDGNDIIIEKNNSIIKKQVSFDFIDNPDLYPTIAATCAGLGVEGRFTGLRNLVHKESDRVAAMVSELSMIGTDRVCLQDRVCPPVFDSHNDHRIAMALAPLAMKIGAIEINNAEVVSKSYPNFWEEINPILKSAHQQYE
ncbi:MAG: hypothetical protein CW336_04645 [Bacteroidetes bacterium]|nr:hypothetical protein [Bacteroidota bacterium]